MQVTSKILQIECYSPPPNEVAQHSRPEVTGPEIAKPRM
jgi:hypothetical protein